MELMPHVQESDLKEENRGSEITHPSILKYSAPLQMADG